MKPTAAGLTLALALVAPGAALAGPPRTWNSLTTGNGHGFAVYDTTQNKINAFLEHPYRYLRAAADPKSDGVGRRNLIYDFYFGLRTGGGSVWLNAASAGEPEYVDQSNIIHAPMSALGISADLYYFEPFGYEGNAMVGLMKAPGAATGFSLFNFHMGSTAQSDTAPDANGESATWLADPGAVVETGPGGGAMVYVPLNGIDGADCAGIYNKTLNGQDYGVNPSCNGNDVVPAFEKRLGADGWMGVVMQYVDNPADAPAAAKALVAWAAKRAPDQILADARGEFDAWRVPPAAGLKLGPDELKVWRQSEAVLRMAQVREVNTATRKNHGMILASLPPGQWHVAWVRDMSYATVALARSGHVAEARAALDFFLNAGPVGAYKSYVNNQDYRISVVRYYGDGSEQADYSGQATPNVEMDGWGLVMWAARQYVDAAKDPAWLSAMNSLGQANYDTLISGVATPLANNLEADGVVRADSSIWEVHDANKRHYAYTTLAAARGFCDLAALASGADKPADAATYQALSQRVRRGFSAFFDDGTGAIPGSVEGVAVGRYTDAAAVEAINWSIVPDPTGRTATATLDRFNQLAVASGGFKRNDDNGSSYDNNEWIFVDLRLSAALRAAGRVTAADEVVSLVVDKAAPNFYLLPELYNAIQADGPIGAYSGSIPMVGFGSGAFVLTLLDRAGLREAHDCGPEVLVDAGALVDGGGTGADLPGACTCDGMARGCSCELGQARSGRTDDPAAVLLGCVLLALVGYRRVRQPK